MTPKIKEPPVPNFAAIKDVKVKKKKFFEYMLPMIIRANEKILIERQEVSRLRSLVADLRKLPKKDAISAKRLFEKYDLESTLPIDTTQFNKLLRRVDVIPPSLVLAQSANESAWGTSRFAQQGKNFFGIWCHTPNCGIKPARRDPGKVHEVQSFKTVEEGVQRYLMTINTHIAYRPLRQLRESLRQERKPLTGHTLATGLLKYSERREDYVNDLRSMIRVNQLHLLNTVPNF